MNTKKAFLSKIAENLSAEDIQLSMLEGLIAAEISMRRQALQINQKELAETLDVSQSLVSRWEKGEVNFQLSTLVKIASALGLKLQSPFEQSGSVSHSRTGDTVVQYTFVWNGSSACAGAKPEFNQILQMKGA